MLTAKACLVPNLCVKGVVEVLVVKELRSEHYTANDANDAKGVLPSLYDEASRRTYSCISSG